jgi:hypothetical protein
MEHKLKPRKVLELPSKMHFAVNRQVLIANELKNVEITVESIENVDGTKPRLLIRLKKVARVFHRRKF